MRLELDLEPPGEAPAAPGRPTGTGLPGWADAARILRHPALRRGRVGTVRTVAEELVWLDTPDGTLARQGLLLESPRRGERRLVRVLPGPGEGWQPGQPATTVPASALPAAAAANLLPVAGFVGRRGQFLVPGPAGTVAVTLLAGRLRGLIAERPVARLVLEGPVPAVLALAHALAHSSTGALPAHAALPEAARALARGESPRPRCRGAPDLSGAETVEAALAVALGHLVEVLLAQQPLAQLAAGPEGVHQMRVGLRRLRSVLKAFRPAVDGPALRAFDAGLQALARLLGPARDWDVFLGGMAADLAAALPGGAAGEPRLAALLRAGEAAREAAYAALREALDGEAFRRLMLEALALLLERRWRDGAAEDAALPERLAAPVRRHAARVLERRWRRLRRDAAEIETMPVEALHALRLEGKRLRYPAELFAALWPGRATARFLRRLSALQEALGLANDAAVARSLTGSLPAGRSGGGRSGGGRSGGQAWAAGLVEGWALARAEPLRAESVRAWERLARCDRFWDEA
ncbi:CHAD domain-containing protein [Roseomonas sp. NAR14]|uniref:CHAD domain-containing protein n=1 Tax=Roseomonas acroporae TaxID=2937791 RepID=A0A9X2BXP5_9PROT|nr:CHAD domain-containing protein [Roseomonas acroporae]MCK8787466.1 CHAD domain-containing protein [Roseomonas acroporae]